MTLEYAKALCRDKIYIYLQENGPSTIEYPADQTIFKNQNCFTYIDKELAEAIILLLGK